MKGEIIKIEKEKRSRNGGKYIRVHFKLENGKWAKMDLVPSFRNFARWKEILVVGNLVGNLRMKDEITVDADSWPKLLFGKFKRSDLSIKKLAELKVFG